VVCDVNGNALYFSRSPIPFYRDVARNCFDVNKQIYYKHIGLYAFSDRALKLIADMGGSELEDAEKLEQLRFLQYGLKIKVHETEQAVIGIDTPHDLQRAEIYAKKMLLSC
jgi:3-deoxy-manno-octulosonate cytidylyltransferase (CMP-KDO synthetase)